MSLYIQKVNSYFSNVRHDLISFLPKKKVGRILEVGAGSGDTLVEIKKRDLAGEVIGIELMKLPGTNQGNPLIDRFIFADFETLQDQFEPNSFDVIICGDVLEHLIDPWAVVSKLNNLLVWDGLLIISTPNARYFEMFLNVFIKGSFHYTDHGLFDKTHLRFFCKKDLVRLVIMNDHLRIDKVTAGFNVFKKSKIYFLNLITLGLFEQLLALQYIVCAKRIKTDG